MTRLNDTIGITGGTPIIPGETISLGGGNGASLDNPTGGPFDGNATLTTGLVSYYKSDTNGSFPDAHGSNNGTITGATFIAVGKINGAYDYDGTNDYVDINFKPTVTAGVLSISLWFKADVTSGRGEFIGQWGAGGAGNASWDLEIDTNNIRMYGYDGSGSSTTTVAFTDTISWHHLVGVWNGSDWAIYLDNSKTTLGSAVTIQESTNYNIVIGAETPGKDINFNGDMDEIGIWEKALTDAEVTALYNSGSGLTY